ncbi:MAG: uroporphyrinogen decarboxylase [Pseudomonadota bacterium]
MRQPSETLRQKAERMRFLKPFCGEALSPPPVWLMRQAGRYLPEYRATRTDAGGFLDLCYNSDLATEVTLQPIRRYGFDAAILFSDILVIPDALGQPVRFVQGEGPQLDAIENPDGIAALSADRLHEHLAPVYGTVSRLREQLPEATALIGFCGAPWTVATYMIAGHGTADQAPARLFAYAHPDAFQSLIDMLVDSSISYLDAQVRAGADVLQIFDTWAGVLPDNELERWVIEPTRRMVSTLREKYPDVPIICFARGVGANVVHYAHETDADGVGCDIGQSMPFARSAFSGSGDGDAETPQRVLQGNLDPLLLVSGGDAMDRRIDEIIETMQGYPFIFNLGHGIVPQTPPENVARLMDRIRKAG